MQPVERNLVEALARLQIQTLKKLASESNDIEVASLMGATRRMMNDLQMAHVIPTDLRLK